MAVIVAAPKPAATVGVLKVVHVPSNGSSTSINALPSAGQQWPLKG